MNTPQNRLQLTAEGIIAGRTAYLARLTEITVAHTAMRTTQFPRTAGSFIFLTLGAAENTAQKIIHRHMTAVLLYRYKIIIACRTGFTEVFFHPAIGTNLGDMHHRFLTATIIT